MATTYSKVLLTGGHAKGGWLTITDSDSLGEVIHTAPSTTGVIDEIWLWATNEGDATDTLILEWDGAEEPQHTRIPPKEPPIQIVPGWTLKNAALTAYAVTDDITVFGYVNRITST